MMNNQSASTEFQPYWRPEDWAPTQNAHAAAVIAVRYAVATMRGGQPGPERRERAMGLLDEARQQASDGTLAAVAVAFVAAIFAHIGTGERIWEARKAVLNRPNQTDEQRVVFEEAIGLAHALVDSDAERRDALCAGSTVAPLRICCAAVSIAADFLSDPDHGEWFLDHVDWTGIRLWDVYDPREETQ